jgi:hypothetical protein
MAHLIDENGGRSVLHCDATMWRTIETGGLDAGPLWTLDCCVDYSIGDIDDGWLRYQVMCAEDDSRKRTQKKLRRDRGFAGFFCELRSTHCACCHRLPRDRKAQFHSLEQNHTLAYIAIVS